MDVLARVLIYLAVGLALLSANIWYLHALYRQFRPAYVIAPFNVVDPSGQGAPDKAGAALAEMMAAKLASIQADLKAAREQPATQANPGLAGPLGATALFVSRPVDIPTDIFAPVDIEATVGGVEVGGLFSFFQRRMAERHAIRFTTYERGDQAIVTANLERFAPGIGLVWIESARRADEIATNAAFALIHARLTERQPGRMRDLELQDFRQLLETIIAIDRVNQRARKGFVVTDQLAGLLTAIEAQLKETPAWPEMIYLAASTAEGVGNLGKATLHYRRLQGLTEDEKAGADLRVVQWAGQRLAALGASGATPLSEAEERFVAAASEFARRMSLPGEDPEIVFATRNVPGIQAEWNVEKRRYQVNPANIATAGLPQYVALMGRFLQMHYDRCFGSGTAGRPFELWNEFRSSVVGFLIHSHDDFRNVEVVTQIAQRNFPLFQALSDIARSAGNEQTQRLALRLLERYECDWTRADLAPAMARIAEAEGLMQPEVITGSMAAAGFEPG
jgi:hypothetical protein